VLIGFAGWGFTGLASLIAGGLSWRVPWSPGFLRS